MLDKIRYEKNISFSTGDNKKIQSLNAVNTSTINIWDKYNRTIMQVHCI